MGAGSAGQPGRAGLPGASSSSQPGPVGLPGAGSSGRPGRAGLLAGLALATALLGSGCGGIGRDLDHLLGATTRLLAGEGAAPATAPQPPAPARPALELPPRQPIEGFSYAEIEPDERGWPRFQVEIEAGGSPYQVARTLLTPLFEVDGKDAPTYVSEAFFQANPGRTPRSIQPGDRFVLTLPPGTFLVRWQEERQQDFGHPARLREYVSEQGDRLIYYLTDPFPIVYEQQPAGDPARTRVQLHPDLAYLLRSGRTDPLRLAQLVYQVESPDLFQLVKMRQLAKDLEPGQPVALEIDRSQRHLDPVRAAFDQAVAVEPVAEPGREHLERAILPPDAYSPYLAVEDALGPGTEFADLPAGQVFRIEYLRDGAVRVAYKTGPEDPRGKRDPYLLRENERWSQLYERLLPDQNTPVKWGPGQPADLPPFPSARDPNARDQQGERAFDYLLPGRAIQLTFSPVRTQFELRAELEFRATLGSLRDRYRDDFEFVRGLVEQQLAKETASR